MDNSAGLDNMGDDVVCSSELIHKVFPSAWGKKTFNNWVTDSTQGKIKRENRTKNYSVLCSINNHFRNAGMSENEII